MLKGFSSFSLLSVLCLLIASFTHGGAFLGAVQDQGGQVFNVTAYGWSADGTDHSSQMNNILNLACTAGAVGGTIYFPPSSGHYRADSEMLIPNNGASPQPKQCNLRLTGAGGGGGWYNNNINQQPPLGATILDLRYTAVDGSAKIETRGLGTLKIDDLSIIDGGASNATPFIHTTNTTLVIRDSFFKGSGSATQDAIVL